jgi:hypothetical protein
VLSRVKLSCQVQSSLIQHFSIKRLRK